MALNGNFNVAVRGVTQGERASYYKDVERVLGEEPTCRGGDRKNYNTMYIAPKLSLDEAVTKLRESFGKRGFSVVVADAEDKATTAPAKQIYLVRDDSAVDFNLGR